jgi:hypothetical protein
VQGAPAAARASQLPALPQQARPAAAAAAAAAASSTASDHLLLTQRTVRAAWQWSSDRQFIALDAYELKRGDGTAIAVLGDGKLPMTSMTPTSYQCVPSLSPAIRSPARG